MEGSKIVQPEGKAEETEVWKQRGGPMFRECTETYVKECGKTCFAAFHC